MHSQVAASVLLLLVAQAIGSPATDCRLALITQPQATLTCDPYLLGELSLRCDSWSRGQGVAAVDFRWFWSPLFQPSSVLVPATTSTTSHDNFSISSSILHLSPLTEDLAGSFWCELHTTGDNEIPINSSAFYLLIPKAYSFRSLPACSRGEVFYRDTTQCAAAVTFPLATNTVMDMPPLSTHTLTSPTSTPTLTLSSSPTPSIDCPPSLSLCMDQPRLLALTLPFMGLTFIIVPIAIVIAIMLCLRGKKY